MPFVITVIKEKILNKICLTFGNHLFALLRHSLLLLGYYIICNSQY